jgi:hypothetical protein
MIVADRPETGGRDYISNSEVPINSKISGRVERVQLHMTR